LGLPEAFGETVFDKMEKGLPDNDLSNPQGGVRFHALLGAWDTFWFVYYGRDKTGVGTLDLNALAADPNDPYPLKIHYPPVTTMGMTFNVYCSWLETVFRGEMAYALDTPASPVGPNLGGKNLNPFEYGEFDTFEIMIGFDYNAMIPFLNPTKSFFFSGQVDNKFAFDFDEDKYRSFFGHNDMKDWRLVYSLLVNTEYYEGKIVPQVLGVSFVNEQSGFVDANITYKPTFTLSFALGYLGIWGDTEQAGLFFGPMKNNDEVYAKLKWSF
jgi:hypothetical protein